MIRRLWYVCALIAWPAIVDAAPAFQFANSAGSSNASTLSVSMTPAGTNRYMVCGVATQNNGRTATSVVFNAAESLSLLDTHSTDDTGTSTQAHAEYWYIVNPSAVTANVVVTMNSATALSFGCVAFSDVDQTTPHGTPAEDGARTNTSSVTVTSATGEVVVDVTSIRVGTTGITEGAGQTNRVDRQSAAGVGNVTLGMSTEAGAASVTMSWTVDDATVKTWAVVAVSLKGAAAPPAGTTITVCASGCTYTNANLQTALNSANDGDTILLESGYTYSAPGDGWILGKRCQSPVWDCITLRTGVNSTGSELPLSSFPAAGNRVTTSDATVFAKMVPTTNNEAALRTVYPGETGAACAAMPCNGSGWTIKWIEFTPKVNWAQRALVRFGTAKAGKEFQSGAWVNTLPNGETQDTLAEIPQYLTLYQCYIHGESFIGQHQGLYLSSKDTRVLHNVIDDIKSFGVETQAITMFNGIGPYDIENNQISATTENVLSGGADTYLRAQATVTGSPTTSSIQLATPLWVHLDGTTEAANLATDIYNNIFIAITHGGVDYGNITCTLTGSTCTLTPALSFTPSVGDTVRWTWVMGGLTFKTNWLHKKLDWFSPIISTVAGVGATAGAGGTLTAGTYCYRVSARAFVSGSTFGTNATYATSNPSTEQCAVAGASGKVTISWTTHSDALIYRIYGRTSGGQNQYWEVTAPTTSYVDDGTAGTTTTVPKFGSIWTVKNNFELKHCDGSSPQGPCLVEGNVIDYSWCCSQSNVVSLKVNNQNNKDVSATVRNLTFRNNWVRHGARGISLTCTSTGNSAPEGPSGAMTDVTFSNNLWTDLSSAWVNTDSSTPQDGVLDNPANSAIFITSGSVANLGARGCVRVTFSHNTFLVDTNDMNGPLVNNIRASTDKMTDLVIRDNIMARDCTTAGCTSNGTNSLKGYVNDVNQGEGTTPWNNTTQGSSAVDHNAWPDGVNTVYTNPTFPTASTYFPTDADLKSSLAGYTACISSNDITGCGLLAVSPLHNAASDGTDIGANVNTIKALTDLALSGTTATGSTSYRPRLRIRVKGR